MCSGTACSHLCGGSVSRRRQCGWRWPLIRVDECMRLEMATHPRGCVHACMCFAKTIATWTWWSKATCLARSKATGLAGSRAVALLAASCACVLHSSRCVCACVGTPVRVAPQVAIRSGRVGLHHCVVGGIHAVRLQLRRQRGRPQWPSVASPCCARSKGSACCTWWRSRHSRAAAFIRVDECIYAGALQRWLWWSMDAWLARSRFTGVVGGRAVCAFCTALDVCMHVGAPVRVADRVATRSGGISFA